MLAGGCLMEYAHLTEQNIFLLQGVLHACTIIPTLYFFKDEIVQRKNIIKLSDQLSLFWNTVQDERLYKCVYFIMFLGAMPNSTSAFTNYMLGPLKFNDVMYMCVGLVGVFFGALGIFLYSQYFRKTNVRVFISIVFILAAVISLIPLILIYRWNLNWGITDFVFAMSDDMVCDTVSMLTVMPIMIITAKICPTGGEAGNLLFIICIYPPFERIPFDTFQFLIFHQTVMYAYLTTTTNLSHKVGDVISNFITDKLAITQTNFDNLALLVIITSILKIAPAFIVFLLPTTTDIEPVNLKDRSSKSKLFGGGSLLLVFVAFVYTLIAGIIGVSNEEHFQEGYNRTKLM